MIQRLSQSHPWTCLLATVFAFTTACAAVAGDERIEIEQDLTEDEYQQFEDDPATIETIIHRGRSDRYTDEVYERGLYFTGGEEGVLSAHIKPHNEWSSHIIGVKGEGTHIRYRGHWDGTALLGIPKLVLLDGGRFTVEEEARIDFTMPGNMYTRQLWVHGDNTGILELAEGFIADRTKDGTVPDALGSIRLGGATLITHHSESLPTNTRPDGRGGVYPNGYIVFENQPGSVWKVRSNAQVYTAALPFYESGRIHTEAHLIHSGRRRDALSINGSGEFTAIGAFGTLNEDRTITKTGEAMLSLEGDQLYFPGARFEVKEGLLRMYSDPGLGHRLRDAAGPYLHLRIHEEASLLMSAPADQQLERIEMLTGSRGWIVGDTRVVASEGVNVAADARLNLAGTLAGDLDCRGRLELFARRGHAVIEGNFELRGETEARFHRPTTEPLLRSDGEAKLGGDLQLHLPGDDNLDELADSTLTLIEAENIEGVFSNAADGETLTTADGRARAVVRYTDTEVRLTDIEKVEE